MSADYTSTTRRARKPHRCDYCAADVPIGQAYRLHTMFDAGDVRTSKAHIACDDVANDYYTRQRTDDDERYISDECLQEWGVSGFGTVAELAAGKGWPDGEVERLTAYMAAK